MRVGVLGTGMVGRAIAGRLAALGHEVMIGTRDVEALVARTSPTPWATRPSPGGARRTRG